MTNSTNAVSNDPQSSWIPLGLSVATHGLLVLLLLLLFSRLPKSESNESTRPGEIVLAVVAEDSNVEYFDEPDADDPSSNPVSAPSPAGDTAPEIPDVETKPLKIAGMVPVDQQANSIQMAATDTSSVPGFQYELTKDDLDLIKADRKLLKSREPTGPTISISMFGSGQLTGRKFVFLIDRSKSMGEQGLRVLRQARSELVEAINKLEKHHLFQIVGYNDRITTIVRRQLLTATDEHKQMVPDFMQNLLAFGGTNHHNAIYAALAFKPDVIVLLNDGGFPELNDGQIEAIRRSASPATQIHTLQFGLGPGRQADHFMKRLAERCSGTYRYIDVLDWHSEGLVKSP